MVRLVESSRHRTTEVFRRICAAAAPFIDAENTREANDQAIGMMTSMIGALTVARLVDDPKLSDRILQIARKRIAETISVSASKAARGKKCAA